MHARNFLTLISCTSNMDNDLIIFLLSLQTQLIELRTANYQLKEELSRKNAGTLSLFYP